ncbi:MAG: hypothetical protein Q8P50_08760 [Bacillota bacterium]|nr:hypothetical protein [Bacillota bacterium]
MYVLFIIAVAFPMVRPVPMPLVVKQETRDLYDSIEKLTPGDTVVMCFDYSPGTASDIHAAAVAVFTHLMRRGVRVIAVSFVPDGPQFAAQALATAPKEKTYGKDFVDLGYRAGGENAIAAFAQDVARTFPADSKGAPLAQLPLMAGIKTARDFALVIEMSGGTPGPAEWVRQVGQAFGCRIGAIVTTVMVPPNLAYVQSKQLMALLYGLRGAAEYELLVGRPGLGLAGMGSQSAAAVFILAAVGIGNVLRLRSKEGSR